MHLANKVKCTKCVDSINMSNVFFTFWEVLNQKGRMNHGFKYSHPQSCWGSDREETSALCQMVLKGLRESLNGRQEQVSIGTAVIQVADTKDTQGHRRYIPFIFYIFPGSIYQMPHWVSSIELNKMCLPKPSSWAER